MLHKKIKVRKGVAEGRCDFDRGDSMEAITSGNREEERNRIEKYAQNGSRSRGEFKGCLERVKHIVLTKL